MVEKRRTTADVYVREPGTADVEWYDEDDERVRVMVRPLLEDSTVGLSYFLKPTRRGRRPRGEQG